MIGIDDFAGKRGHRYGTIVRDLERRCVIDIPPDREAATATGWLTDETSWKTPVLPFLTTVQRSMVTIHKTVCAGIVDPAQPRRYQRQ